MELLADNDGWKVLFASARIEQIKVDFQLTFLISDGPDSAQICIEQPGHLRRDSIEFTFIPGQTDTIAPMLILFNAAVTAIEITKAGRLSIAFEKHGVVSVLPHTAYEAWQVGLSAKMIDALLVCTPGGDVAVFNQSGSLNGTSIN